MVPFVEGLAELYQSDFEHGTYIIDEPGIYRLAEVIGNVVANVQAFMAKAFLSGDFDGSYLDLTRLNITQEVFG